MQPVYSEVASKGLTSTKKYRFSHAKWRYLPSFVGVLRLQTSLSWADSGKRVRDASIYASKKYRSSFYS